MDKKILRKEILQKRDNIQNIKEKSSIIFEKIKKLNSFKNAKSIMLFASFGSEVYTYDFMRQCISMKKIVSIPYVKDAKNSIMISTKLESIDDFVSGYKGIMELPKEKIIEIDKKTIDVVITPCVCYDYARYRIGYGKGFYDRFFTDINPYKIGICLDECIVDKIKTDEYDVPVDIVITDKRVFL